MPESQQVPSSWTAATVARVSSSSSPEADEHLVEHDVVQDLDVGFGAEQLSEAGCVVAAAFDHPGDPVASKSADRGVDREPARATGELRVPVHLIPRRVCLCLLEVARPHAHRRPVRLGIRAEGNAGVVGHVQPLVRVRRPGVGTLGTGGKVAKARRCGGPEAERPVHVEPRAGALDGVRDRGDVVARAGVDVAELRTDDRRPIARRERRGQQLDPHSPLLVGRNRLDLRAADAEVAQGAIDGDVALLAHEDADARCALEPVACEVPACPREDPVPRRRQGCHVRHLAAGHEAGRDACRKQEQLAQPLEHDLLDDARARRRPDQAGVLIPGRGEPVRGDGDRQRAPDDEAEEPARRHRHDPRLGRFDQLGDDLRRVGCVLRQRAAERGPELLDRRLRRDRPVVERVDEPRRVVGGEAEEVPHGVHRAPR